MIIKLSKFGTTLVSRPAGREAWAAFQSTLKTIAPEENIEVGFDDVLTFSPSWADEFLTPLKKEYGSRVILRKTSNPSVRATLDILELK